ncbi:MAG: hypothetical protein LBS06_04430 [Treponema sp.]|jgi:hypothetical protein|nr:hypothetical protein [Treponema sp.]
MADTLPSFKQTVNLPDVEGADPVSQQFALGRKFPALFKGPEKQVEFKDPPKGLESVDGTYQVCHIVSDDPDGLRGGVKPGCGRAFWKNSDETIPKIRVFEHKKTPREKEVRKPGGLPDNTEPEKQRLY